MCGRAKFILFVIVIVSSCSVRPKPKTSALTSTLTPSPRVSTQPGHALPEYQLGYGDVIEIKFFRNSEFNETVTIRPDGRISLLKIGELNVVGLTPGQLDRILTDAYGTFIIEPQITVIVRQFGGYRVYVLGEVNAPGGYPIQRDMTLLQALAVAGGPKLSAKLGSVMLLRRSTTGEVGAIKVDLVQSIEPGSRLAASERDLFLQPRDIIFVPKTFIANVSDFMRQLYAGFLPPLDLYLRAVLFYDR